MTPAARTRTSPWPVTSRIAVAAALLATGASCAPADVTGAGAAPKTSAALALTDDLSPAPSTPGVTHSPETAVPAAPGSALAAVDELAVKGRAPKTGYSRDQFGPAWADVDHNGCDTRNDILARDLVDVVTREGTHGCVVLTGTLHDTYSGETIAFQRGETTSSLVQIDHVKSRVQPESA